MHQWDKYKLCRSVLSVLLQRLTVKLSSELLSVSGEAVRQTVLIDCITAYQVSHNIRVVALLQHFNLFLDFQNFILVTQRDDLDCNNFLCASDLCLVH